MDARDERGTSKLKTWGYRLALLTLSLMLVSTSAACGGAGDGDNGGAGTPAAQKIVVGVEAGGPYTAFHRGIVNEFTSKTGVEVEFMEVPHENMHDRFVTEALSGAGAIDVYQTDQIWVSEFAEQGFLEPLDERLSEEDTKDFLPSALETVTYEDKIYGLPYLVHTPILYYRTDLFEAAGLSQSPKNWAEFRQYAKKLTDKATGVYGTVVEGKQHPEPVTHLMDRIFQAGGAVLDDKNHVVFDSPEVMDAFNFMLALQYGDGSSPAGAVGYDNADVHNLFMQGKAAMVSNWPYMYTMANDTNQSKVAGKFSVALQPAGKEQTSAVWSWGYGISSASKNKEAAWQFVNWATSSDVVQRMGKQFVNPVPRASALEALKADKTMKESDLKAIEVMSEAVELGKNAVTTPKFPAVMERLSLTLSKIMSVQGKPEAVVKETAEDLKKLLEK